MHLTRHSKAPHQSRSLCGQASIVNVRIPAHGRPYLKLVALQTGPVD